MQEKPPKSAALKLRPFEVKAMMVPECLHSGFYWELRTTEVVVTTGAVTGANLQSNHHHQQTNSQLFTGQMPFLSPNQQRQSTGASTNFKTRHSR